MFTVGTSSKMFAIYLFLVILFKRRTMWEFAQHTINMGTALFNPYDTVLNWVSMSLKMLKQ